MFNGISGCGRILLGEDELGKQTNQFSINYHSAMQSIIDIGISVSVAIAAYLVAKKFVVIDLNKWLHWTVLSLVATIIVRPIMPSCVTILNPDLNAFQQIKSSFIFLGIAQLCYQLYIINPAQLDRIRLFLIARFALILIFQNLDEFLPNTRMTENC